MQYFTFLPYLIRMFRTDTVFHADADHLSILYVAAGSVTLSDPEGRQRSYTGGGLCLIPQEMAGDYDIFITGLAWYALIHIDLWYVDYFSQFEQLRFSADTSAAPAGRMHALGQLLQKTVADYFQPETAARSELVSNIDQVLSLLARDFCGERARLPDPARQRKSRLIFYLLTHYNTGFGLDEVAEMMQMSRSYTSAYIRKCLGASLMQVLTEIRLNQASRALLHTRQPIGKIAADAGFPNMIAMNAAFKSAFGMPPSAYRRQFQGEVSPSALLFSDNVHYPEDLACYRTLPETSRRQVTLSSEIETRITLGQTLPKHFPEADILCIYDASTLLDYSQNPLLMKTFERLPIRYIRVLGLTRPELHMHIDAVPAATAEAWRILDYIAKLGKVPFLFNPVEYDDDPKRFEQFLKDCILRYGRPYVSDWLFEWAPTIYFLDELRQDAAHGADRIRQIVQQTLDHIRILKSILPEARFGGFSMSRDPDGRFTEALFKALCDDCLTPAFMTCTLSSTIHQNAYADYSTEKYQLSMNSELLLQQFDRYDRLWTGYFGETAHDNIVEIIFNEHTDNLLNDGMFNAAYLISNALRLAGRAMHLILPTLSDITYYALPDKPGLFFGSNSLFTSFYQPKPVFFALDLYCRMKGELLQIHPSQAITCDPGTGTIYILMVNHKFPDAVYCSDPLMNIKPENLHTLFPAYAPERRKIIIDALPSGDYIIETHRLNAENGSILDTWIASGARQPLPQTLLETLVQTTHPAFEYHTAKAAGTITIVRDIAVQEICLVRIYPV